MTLSSDIWIAVSGGFDPPQVGHIRMINDAARLGNVVILLNSDEWLIRKKNYSFMPFAERKEMLEALSAVTLVLPAMDDDDTVCASIHNLKSIISYFGKGGDRTPNNTPEILTCDQYGIEVIYGLGGYKVQSSSDLVRNVQKN